MTEKKAELNNLVINDNYGGGSIVENYSGKIGKYRAAFAGQTELKNKQWRSQPMIDLPFKNRKEALKACDILIDVTDCF